MKKVTLIPGLLPAMALAMMILSFLPFASAQSKPDKNRGTYIDTRDNRQYAWIRIGNLCWMAENLKYASKTGSWDYGDDTIHFRTYGRLYNWKTAQTACPKGWHLPAEKEWNAMIKVLGGPEKAGLMYQTIDTVVKVMVLPPTGSVRLTSLLGGTRHADGSYIGLNYWGGFWSSSQVNDTVAVNMLFAHGRGDAAASTNDKKSGFSVRCVKK